MNWYWLSFATDDDFLGGCYVEADPSLAHDGDVAAMSIDNNRSLEPIWAVRKSHLLGINPGGHVHIIGPIPPTQLPPDDIRNRLLSKSDLIILGAYVNNNGQELKGDPFS